MEVVIIFKNCFEKFYIYGVFKILVFVSIDLRLTTRTQIAINRKLFRDYTLLFRLQFYTFVGKSNWILLKIRFQTSFEKYSGNIN